MPVRLLIMGAVLIAAGLFSIWYHEQAVLSGVGRIWRENTKIDPSNPPKIEMRKEKRGTIFSNIGGFAEFSPKPGFQGFEQSFSEVRRASAWMWWLGVGLFATGVAVSSLGIFVSTLFVSAIAPR